MTLLFSLLLLQSLSEDGARAMREGRFADAERAYRHLVKSSPGIPQWQLNLGLALHSQGKPMEAISAFDVYLKAVPAEAWADSLGQRRQ